MALDISFSSLLVSIAAAAQLCASTLISPWSSTATENVVVVIQRFEPCIMEAINLEDRDEQHGTGRLKRNGNAIAKAGILVLGIGACNTSFQYKGSRISYAFVNISLACLLPCF